VDDVGPTFYRVLTAPTLAELWPDEDRRDAALLRVLVAAHTTDDPGGTCETCGRFGHSFCLGYPVD